MTPLLVFLLVLALLIGWIVAIYNRFVRLRAEKNAAWADIEVQLKRRANLVPNLVRTVRGYMRHERETLREVIQARRAALAATDPETRAKAESTLGAALGRLLAVAESYPEIKANQNFLHLQTQLAELENAIQNARRYYNAVVRDLNTRVESFPDLIIARAFGFTKAPYFEIQRPEDREVPEVRFP